MSMLSNISRVATRASGIRRATPRALNVGAKRFLNTTARAPVARAKMVAAKPQTQLMRNSRPAASFTHMKSSNNMRNFAIKSRALTTSSVRSVSRAPVFGVKNVSRLSHKPVFGISASIMRSPLSVSQLVAPKLTLAQLPKMYSTSSILRCEESDENTPSNTPRPSLYVGNLAWECTENDLVSLFNQFGPVRHVKIMVDRDTGRSRGFGFVDMSSPEEAQAALTALNGHTFGGRVLRIAESTSPKRKTFNRRPYRDSDNEGSDEQ